MLYPIVQGLKKLTLYKAMFDGWESSKDFWRYDTSIFE